MPGQAVYLDRPPHQAFLLGWGRARHGWWGCVTFRLTVQTTDGMAELPAADIAAVQRLDSVLA